MKAGDVCKVTGRRGTVRLNRSPRPGETHAFVELGHGRFHRVRVDRLTVIGEQQSLAPRPDDGEQLTFA